RAGAAHVATAARLAALAAVVGARLQVGLTTVARIAVAVGEIGRAPAVHATAVHSAGDALRVGAGARRAARVAAAVGRVVGSDARTTARLPAGWAHPRIGCRVASRGFRGAASVGVTPGRGWWRRGARIWACRGKKRVSGASAARYGERGEQ